jgi:polyhydroxyalkanoate synthesis regulator phasin
MMHQIVDMLDPQKMTRTFFNLAKDYTEAAMKTMKTSSEMYEKSMDTMIKQGMVAQAEGQKLLNDWVNMARQSQEQYLEAMEENIKKMSALVNTDSSRKPGKS